MILFLQHLSQYRERLPSIGLFFLHLRQRRLGFCFGILRSQCLLRDDMVQNCSLFVKLRIHICEIIHKLGELHHPEIIEVFVTFFG